MRLTGARVFDPLKGFQSRDLCIQGERIARDCGGVQVNLPGCWLIPGLTDLHFHGCRGADFSDGDGAGLQAMADYEAGTSQLITAQNYTQLQAALEHCHTILGEAGDLPSELSNVQAS